MATMVVKHRVTNFESWKNGFDPRAARRDAERRRPGAPEISFAEDASDTTY